jgi:hypothetical protein
MAVRETFVQELIKDRGRRWWPPGFGYGSTDRRDDP